MTSKERPPHVALIQMMTGYYLPQMLYAAARLGIADLLHRGARSAADVVAATGASALRLERLLRGLVNAGILLRELDGGYSLTPVGSYLRSDIQGSQRNWVLLYGGAMYQAWQGLAEAIGSDRSAFEHIHGVPYYDYLEQHPDMAALMDATMDQTAEQWLAAFVGSYDFSAIHTLVDVGGGHGVLLAAVLRGNPHLRGILYDLPHVVPGAEAVLVEAGVLERCAVVAGNVLDGVPPGGDAYVLARVLFNWNDEQATAILRNCYHAMAPEGKLLVVDGIMPDNVDASPHATALTSWDLFLLVQFGAKLRTEAEFRALFAASSFTLRSIKPTGSQFSLIEGVHM